MEKAGENLEKGLIPVNNPEHKVSELLKTGRNDLGTLVLAYLRSQVPPEKTHTWDAKQRDLLTFVGFYRETFGHLRPDEWYRSTTEAFLDQLGKGRVARPSKTGVWPKKKWSQSTIRRTYDTLHHFVGWAHRTADIFDGENPMDGVKPPPEPEAEWKGLEQRDIIRLRNAAMTLRKNPGRGTDTGHRDYTFYYTVEGTGLRADEVCNLDWEQYDGRRFNHVRQKSGHVRKTVAITKKAREALDEWKAAGEGTGPIFPTRTGRSITRNRAWAIVDRIKNQANAQLPDDEKIHVSPHIFRHALLRRIREENGDQAAFQQSGHRSTRYISRYTMLKQAELEEALDELD